MTINLKRMVLPGLGLAVLAITLSTATTPVGAVMPAAFQDGKALYAKKCANCHGLDGAGQTAKGKEYKLKDLRSPEAQKMSDAQMLDLLAKGKGKMTGLGKTLSEAELKSLVAYTRELAKKK